LYLLSYKLHYKAHGLNIQNHELAIPINEISKVSYYSEYGFVLRGIIISTTHGRIENLLYVKSIYG